MTKICNKCKRELDLCHFGNKSSSGDGKLTHCKDCRRAATKLWKKTPKGKFAHAKYQRKRNRDKKLWLISVLFPGGAVCSKCPEDHIACLEFHHLDKGQKEFAISAGKGKSKQLLLDEAKKCLLICSNCHKKLHWDEEYTPRA